AGFRELIGIGRTRGTTPALFGPDFVRPRPVVDRRHRFEVDERLDAAGAVLIPLDMASVDRALEGALDAGAEAIAVCLLHAHLNPAHEHAAADAAKGTRPRLPVARSADWVAEEHAVDARSTPAP